MRVSGFGGSVVAVPLLAPIVTLATAVPMMGLFGVTNFSIVIWQQWRDLTVRDVWRNITASVIFFPFGIWLTYFVTESTMRLTLGVICIFYALYNFSNLPRPHLKHSGWGWFFGVIAGLLSGAFGVGGVPTVIYADTQRWEPERFRLNMFSYFLITSAIGLVSRYFAGQLTEPVIAYWLIGIPFLLCGLALGKWLAARLERRLFRIVVLLLLIVLGSRLIWGVLT